MQSLWDLIKQASQYEKEKKWEDAISCYDKAIEQNKDIFDVWFKRGLAYFQMAVGNQIYFDKHLNPNSLTFEGVMYVHNDEKMKKIISFFIYYDQAINSYDQALRLKPDDLDVLANKGQCLLHLGGRKRDIELINSGKKYIHKVQRKGYRIHDPFILAIMEEGFNKSTDLFKSGANVLARMEVLTKKKEEESINIEHFNTYYTQGERELKNGKAKNAVENFEQALIYAEKLDHPVILYNVNFYLAQCHLMDKNIKRAEAYVREAESIAVKEKKTDMVKSVKDFKKSITNSYFNEAIEYMNNGDYANAIQSLKNMAPGIDMANDPEIGFYNIYHRSMCYIYLGNQEEALKCAQGAMFFSNKILDNSVNGQKQQLIDLFGDKVYDFNTNTVSDFAYENNDHGYDKKKLFRIIFIATVFLLNIGFTIVKLYTHQPLSYTMYIAINSIAVLIAIFLKLLIK